jgi:hypothetical protein
MSWLFSQALAEEYSVDTFLDGEQSVQLSGNLTQQAYCAPDKMTAFSRLSRFGMTYKPLTASRGEELLTLYLAAFPAKTSAPQGGGLASTESAAGCGEKWRASFTKYNPDSRSWKTHQCSLLGDLEEFSATWPQWGLMRNGECWEQQTLAQTTSETASGLWATPAASDGQRGGTITDKMTGQSLPQMVNTPAKWPTPTVQDSEQAGGKGCIASGKRGLSLHQATQLWPSPNARDWKDSGASQGNRKFPNLGTQVHWPTPRSCSAMAATLTDQGQRFPNLETVMAHTDQATIGGQLNPMWVEWLMGWPLGWTDLKPLATDKFHSAQQQPGSFSVNNGEICL